jgi:uncharacterized protein YjbI with pentapeptide repeats
MAKAMGIFLGKGYLSRADTQGTPHYMAYFGDQFACMAADKTDDAIVNVYSYGIQFRDGSFLTTPNPTIVNIPGLPGIPGATFWSMLGDAGASTQWLLNSTPGGLQISFKCNFPSINFSGQVGGAYEPDHFPCSEMSAISDGPYVEPFCWTFEPVTPGQREWPAANGYSASCVACNLTMLDTSSQNFIKSDISQSNLTGGNFSGSTWAAVNAKGANVTGADFSDLTGIECVFDKVDFTTIKNKALTGATFDQCTFNSANLNGMTLSDLKTPTLDKCAFDSANLSAADLHGLTLTSCSFDNAQLPNANLSGVKASACSFANTSMAQVVATTDTALTQCSFSGADFTEATNLKGVDFHLSSFLGARMQGAELDAAILYSCVFDGLDLSQTSFGTPPNLQPPTIGPPSAANPRTSFKGATMMGTLIQKNWAMLDLTDAVIKGLPGDLVGLKAQYCRMSGPTTLAQLDMRGANFANAELSVDMGGTKLTPNGNGQDAVAASFANATLHGTNLSGALLTGADLTAIQGGASPTVPGVILSDAYMPGAVLTGAVLDGANLAGAQIYGDLAKLDNAVLYDADLSNATLSGVHLEEAKVSGATFDGANLIGAHLKGVALTPSPTSGRVTSFVGANLIGVDCTDATFGKTSLANAVIALDQGVPFFSIGGADTNALNKNRLPDTLRTVFSERNRTLKRTAVAVVITPDQEWDVIQYPEYQLSLDSGTGALSLLVAGVTVLTLPDAAAYAAGFDAGTIPQAFATASAADGLYLDSSAEVDVVVKGGAWTISMLPPPSQAQGYHTLRLVMIDNDLGAFGSKLMYSQLGDDNKLELVIADVQPTTLLESQMTADTLCPNHVTYGEQGAGTTWMQMMTASDPPKPPTCVPSGARWCNPAGVG